MMDCSPPSPTLARTGRSGPPGPGASETWDAMEARHAAERIRMLHHLERRHAAERRALQAERAYRSCDARFRPTMDMIASQFALIHGVSRSALLGRQRVRPIVHARQAAWAAMREAGFSSVEIGRFVGRDHTTVLQGVAAHQARTANLNAGECGGVQ